MLVLRPYQQEAVDAALVYWKKHPEGNPIIEAATGAGKSIILAKLTQEILKENPSARIMLLTHVAELLTQNFQKLISLWPSAPVGLYSYSLGKKETGKAITIAGIQSCWKKSDLFGFIDYIIIDECHLLPHHEEGMYRTLIEKLKSINPNLRILGLSATPWRMKGGSLIQGSSIFTEIIYKVGIKELIAMGYLCTLIGKELETQADLSNVQTVRGDFNSKQMSEAFDQESLINKALDELITYAQDRKAWLLFGSGIQHAIHLRDNLINRGIEAACITSETPPLEREGIIRMFKQGERYRALTNNTVLTTGIDLPRVDLIGIFRGTKSAGLFVQIAGRGARLSPETDKTNCMVLDFGGNLERFGPIDMISNNRNEHGKSYEGVRFKICPGCREPAHSAVKECPECKHKFPCGASPKYESEASNAQVLSVDIKPEWFEVDDVVYKEYPPRDGKPSALGVHYVSGDKVFREWVAINHPGKLRERAIKWLIDHIPNGSNPEKITIEDIVKSPNILTAPKKIYVCLKGRFEQIIDYEFDKDIQLKRKS